MKDSKGPLLGGAEVPERKGKWKVRTFLAEAGFTAVLCLVIWGLLRLAGRSAWASGLKVYGNGRNGYVGAGSGWEWKDIESSTDLLWHRCDDVYDCAKLNVPLDWLEPADGRQATIAVIRYNATDRTNYKGPVFINPGGPGGSGVWFVKRLAPYYQYVVGKNHDIISFDPRGIGQSTPYATCWNGTLASTSSLLWDLSSPPVLDAHPGIIYEAHTHASAFSQQCATQLSESGKYMSTASVARDMLHMMEKLGEEKLKYWGFSYGTFLGVTFASLFPDKVSRIVNDGNVDATDFAAGSGTHFLADAEAIVSSFYTFCHAAGPLNCAFYSSSPSAIEERLSSLLEKLRKYPVIVSSSPTSPRPEIINYSRLRKLIASALYRPLLMFPSLASALSGLEVGDGKPFLEMVSEEQVSLPLCENPQGSLDPSDIIEEVDGNSDAGKAILCSDAPDLDDSVDAFQGYVDTLVNISKSAGATMADMRLGCVGWAVKAKWRFGGPFGAPQTSHPILFIANTADNVTPLLSARANSARFPGSRILIQNSYGHTSLTAPSKCTALTIRHYFQTGELPKEGSICQPDLVPFDRWNLTVTGPVGAEAEEEEMLGLSLRKLMLAPIPGLRVHGL